MDKLIKILFCYSLLVVASFIQAPLMDYNYDLHFILAFALAQFFDRNYALIASILFIITGLSGLEVFSFGGGFAYILEPSFGFILGLVPLCLLSFFFKYFPEGLCLGPLRNPTPIIGILVAHLLGLIWLFISGKFCIANCMNLINYQLPWDVAFALLIRIFMPIYDTEPVESI